MSKNGVESNESSGRKCGWRVEEGGPTEVYLRGSEEARRAGRTDFVLVSVLNRLSPLRKGLRPTDEIACEGVIVDRLVGLDVGGEGGIRLGSTGSSWMMRRGETGTSFGRYTFSSTTFSFRKGSLSKNVSVTWSMDSDRTDALLYSSRSRSAGEGPAVSGFSWSTGGGVCPSTTVSVAQSLPDCK